MYTVLGVTGQVGAVVAKQLLGKSLPVRAVLRSASKELAWQANGAITLLAGLQDASALEAAFDKATAVFIMTPPLLDAQDPMAEHDKMLAALSIALYKTRPKKLVFLSSIGAHLSSGTGAIKKLYDLEQCFRRLPIPTMSIRAAWFMENFFGGLDIARQSGYLPSFLDPTDAAIPMIATHDIGVVAAKMLQSEWTGHHNIELEGPCRYSADDVASILSSRFKRDVTAKPIPAHLYEATYRSFGFTPAAATMMAEMHNGFNSGHIRFEGNGQQHFSADTLLEDVLTAQLPPI